MTGADLKEYRERHGFTQKEIAHLLGVTTGYIANVEHDRMPLPKRWEELFLKDDSGIPFMRFSR